jgi:vacuolar protein sorting-associated protein 11
LDAQRIQTLTVYLQELHSQGLASSDHTTLLLNAYTKLKDHAKLESFIKTESQSSEGEEDNQPPFDLDTVIRVCRQAGYFDHAAYLAKRYNREDDYLRIVIEDKGEYSEALTHFRASDPEEVSASPFTRATAYGPTGNDKLSTLWSIYAS